MKKSILLALTLMALASQPAWANPVAAAEDTASPSSTQTTQNLKQRIEKIVDEKRDQVQGTISDLSQLKRGFIGEVQRVSQETITVKNHKGTQIISLNGDVTLMKAGKSITIESIAVGDWVLIIGTVQEDTFTPKRILVSSTTLRPKDHVVALGSITNKTAKDLTVQTRKGETLTFVINPKTTRFQNNTGDKAKADQFVKDVQVLVVGYETADGKTATTVRAIVPLEKNE